MNIDRDSCVCVCARACVHADAHARAVCILVDDFTFYIRTILHLQENWEDRKSAPISGAQFYLFINTLCLYGTSLELMNQ